MKNRKPIFYPNNRISYDAYKFLRKVTKADRDILLSEFPPFDPQKRHSLFIILLALCAEKSLKLVFLKRSLFLLFELISIIKICAKQNIHNIPPDVQSLRTILKCTSPKEYHFLSSICVRSVATLYKMRKNRCLKSFIMILSFG